MEDGPLTCVTPKEDLMNAALKHYDEASAAIHHWNSDIPKAIRQYYSEDEKLDKAGLIIFGISVGIFIGFIAGILCQ